MMRTIIKGLFVSSLLLFARYLPAQNTGSQNPVADSLMTLLNDAKTDTTKVILLNNLFLEYEFKNGEDALEFLKQALKIATKSKFKKGLALVYTHFGYSAEDKGNYPEAMKNYAICMKIQQKLKSKSGIANSYSNIGNVHHFQGNYSEAIRNHFASLKIRESIKDTVGLATCYNNIGNVYKRQNNLLKALKNYFNSLKLRTILKDKVGMATILNNIGLIYILQENYTEALKNLNSAMKVYLAIGNKNKVALVYNNIGETYFFQGDFKQALTNHLASLKIRKSIGDKSGIASSTHNIGSVFFMQKKFNEAKKYLLEAEILAKALGIKETLKEIYNYLSKLSYENGDFKKAYENQKLFYLYSDSLSNEEIQKKTVETQMTYDFEKKEAVANAEHKKEIENHKILADEKSRKQKLVIVFVCSGLALVFLLAFFIYKGYRSKKKANELLSEKNSVIEKQKTQVEEKNKSITSSINYAKRIQQAILPSSESIKTHIPDSFIFFRPKDIVSGDFYWFSVKNDKLIVAVADCTGHGVPGAFMSMIGNTLLNEIVNEKNITQPSQILNMLNKGVIEILHQNNADENSQDDGMDISILVIDKKTNSQCIAMAGHIAYLINGKDVNVINGNLFSIGGMSGMKSLNFTEQTIETSKDSSIYLLTDGFVDQFGGEKRSKFLSSRLEKLLIEVHELNMLKQSELVEKAFDEWKGENKQIDDVLLIGIRF